MKIGTTFDFQYATDLELDWKETLNKIIEMKLTPIRIGVKWSVVQKDALTFNWKDYDYILGLLDKEGIDVILTIGMKSPRWPEFHIPEFLENDADSFNPYNFKKELFNYLKKTINRYKELKCIKYIQLENEPFLASGPNKWKIPYEFLKEEIDYVTYLTKLPIILNDQGLSTTGIIPEIIKGRFFKKLKLFKLCDVFGFNIYPCFEHKSIFGINQTFKANFISWKYFQFLYNRWNKRKATGNKRNALSLPQIDQVETGVKAGVKRNALVTELQAEPWQIEKVSLTNAYANKTCTPETILNSIEKLEHCNIETLLLWGSEFHIKCAKLGNEEWIKTIYN